MGTKIRASCVTSFAVAKWRMLTDTYAVAALLCQSHGC